MGINVLWYLESITMVVKFIHEHILNHVINVRSTFVHSIIFLKYNVNGFGIAGLSMAASHATTHLSPYRSALFMFVVLHLNLRTFGGSTFKVNYS